MIIIDYIWLVVSNEFWSGELPQKSDPSRFRVSGFGFRKSKPNLDVGFGFLVSSIETNFRCRFRVSGFIS